jgi:hypothetical protein
MSAPLPCSHNTVGSVMSGPEVRYCEVNGNVAVGLILLPGTRSTATANFLPTAFCRPYSKRERETPAINLKYDVYAFSSSSPSVR